MAAAAAAAMAGPWQAGALAEEQAALTEAVLAERGVEYLHDAALRSLVVGKRLTVRNLATGEFFEARYGTDGQRRVSRISEEPAAGGATVETAPYVIHDARITTSYRGEVFEVRVYHVDGRYLAARSADGGAVTWEIVTVK